eukprot:COSAG02_NODE_26591_length_629_cov_2.007547_1_plen_86_part_01
MSKFGWVPKFNVCRNVCVGQKEEPLDVIDLDEIYEKQEVDTKTNECRTWEFKAPSKPVVSGGDTLHRLEPLATQGQIRLYSSPSLP